MSFLRPVTEISGGAFWVRGHAVASRSLRAPREPHCPQLRNPEERAVCYAPTAFKHLIRQAQAGSEEAARTIIDRCGGPLLLIINRRLSKKLRPLFDSTDFTQLVWMDFFTRAVRERSFENPRELGAFLARL